MDSRDGMRTRASQAERDLAIMRSPSPDSWPLYPFAALSRPKGPGQFPELGILCDFSGHTGQQGYQHRVVLCNLLDIGSAITSVTELLAQPHTSYDSFEAIVADGWRLD